MIKVTHDLFGIARRLLKINPDYKVFYNNKEQRYEVHTDSLQFVVPYESLDSRTLEYARKTLVKNSDVLFEEIEKKNVKEPCSSSCLDKAAVELRQRLGYANRTGQSVTFTRNHLQEF